MPAVPVPPLLPALAAIPNPRRAFGRRHPLPAVLALSRAAMLAGRDRLLAIAEWGRDPNAWEPLARRLGFARNRTPCVTTLHRVSRRLDAAAFERAVGGWAAEVAAALAAPGDRGGSAMDVKTLRASRRPGVPAVQLLGTLGHGPGLVLAEVPVDPARGEAAALPELLAGLVPDGRADAAALLALWRGRWGIENRLHRGGRDAGFAEDRSAARVGGVLQALAATRNTVIALLRAHGHSRRPPPARPRRERRPHRLLTARMNRS